MSRRVPKASDIKYTEKDIRKASKRPELPHGLHYFVHTAAEIQVQEGGSYEGTLKVVTRCAALKDPEDANSKVRPMVRDSIWLPFANPEIPGHQAPEGAAHLAAQDLRACFPEEIPEMPRKNEEGDLVFEEEVVAEAGSEEMPQVEAEKRDEVMQKVFDKCFELLDNPKLLLASGAGFVGEVGHDKTGRYTNITRKYSAVPEDGTLYNWGQAEEEEEAPVRRKRARRKKKA